MMQDFYRVEENTVVIPVGSLNQFSGPSASNDKISAVNDNVNLMKDVSERKSDTLKVPSSQRADSTNNQSLNDADEPVQIICHYNSKQRCPSPVSLPQPTATCLQSPPSPSSHTNIGDFSSIVEIDGDCVIIHSRLDDVSATPPSPSTPIAERCRRFYQARLRGRRPLPALSDDDTEPETDAGPSSVDSGRESGSDGGSTERSSRLKDVKEKSKVAEQPPGTLQLKMDLLRREMTSLMHQDDALFRQLLALNDSIQTLRQRRQQEEEEEELEEEEGSLSEASSLSSLAELAAESCSPASTLSSIYSRQSHLSSDSGTYAMIKPKYQSQPHLSAELVTAEENRPRSSHSFTETTALPFQLRVTPPGPQMAPRTSPQMASRGSPQMAPRGLSQMAPTISKSQRAPRSPKMSKVQPSFPHISAKKLLAPSKHRKQASCDSGIAEHELRGALK